MCSVVVLGIALELALWRMAHQNLCTLVSDSYSCNLTKAYFPHRARTPRGGDNPKLGVGYWGSTGHTHRGLQSRCMRL